MFENATMLTHDFVKNFFVYESELTPKLEKALFKEHYFIMCQFTRECHYSRPTPEKIEQFLTDGKMIHGGKEIKSPITDEADRKHFFLMAQAKQFIYDCEGGRGNMVKDEVAQKLNLCKDKVDYVKMLGLYQRNITTV